MLPSLARLRVASQGARTCLPCASTGKTYDSIRDILPEELIDGGKAYAPEWIWKSRRTDEYKFNKFTDDGDNDDICAICQESLNNPSGEAGSDVSEAEKLKIEVLQEKNPECGHVFHRECLRKYVRNKNQAKNECPICKVPIHKSVIDSLMGLSRREMRIEDLTRAARKGNIQMVRRLLEIPGIDVNAENTQGHIALVNASYKGHTEIVWRLLDAGANVDAHDYRGWTALLAASAYNHLTTVKVLIERGANVNTPKSDSDRRTALALAAAAGHLEVVRFLLDNGAIVDAAGTDDVTPLMLATETGHYDIVKMLLESGADVNVKDEFGDSSSMLAVKKDKFEIAKLLIKAGAELDEDVISLMAMARAAREASANAVAL